MVTQELISYVKAELNKGKTHEEIKQALLSGGGWNADDINEGFAQATVRQGGIINPINTAAPIPPITSSPTITPAVNPVAAPQAIFKPEPSASPFPVFPKTPPIQPISVIPPSYANNFKNSFNIAPKKKGLSGALKSLLIFIFIAGIIGGGWYFLRPQISSFFGVIGSTINGFFASSEEPIATPYVREEIPEIVTPNIPAVLAPEPVKDCGTTVAPDGKNVSSATNDPVLICLGAHIQYCSNATAILESNAFPTQFEVVHQGDSCSFRLSYKVDSKIVSVNGNHLAGQYVSCPVGVVKSLDESDPKNIMVQSAHTSNAGLYASEVYMYGTVVLFLENNFTKSNIMALGCNGSFIDSAIDSYNLMKSKK